MLSPATLLVSAVATAAIGVGPATTATGFIATTSPVAQTVSAPSSAHCPKSGHHKRCRHGRDDGPQLSEEETAVVGAALVVLALAAL